MNSKDAHKLFSALLEGELSAEEEDQLRDHFARYPEDLEAYREFESTVMMLRAMPREEAPEGFTAEVMDRVRRAKHLSPVEAPMPKRPSIFPLRQVAAVAAMLVVGFGGTFAWYSIAGPGSVTGSDLQATQAAAPTAEVELAAATTISGSDSASEAPAWDEVQGLQDGTLRQVRSGDERPSIVY